VKIGGWRAREQTWKTVLLGDAVVQKVRIELELVVNMDLGWKCDHEK
jgi:hypothetical protein